MCCNGFLGSLGWTILARVHAPRADHGRQSPRTARCRQRRRDLPRQPDAGHLDLPRADDRAGALATLITAGSLGRSVPVLGLGIILEHLSPRVALLIFGAAVGLGIVAAPRVLVRRPVPRHASPRWADGPQAGVSLDSALATPSEAQVDSEPFEDLGECTPRQLTRLRVPTPLRACSVLDGRTPRLTASTLIREPTERVRNRVVPTGTRAETGDDDRSQARYRQPRQPRPVLGARSGLPHQRPLHLALEVVSQAAP